MASRFGARETAGSLRQLDARSVGTRARASCAPGARTICRRRARLSRSPRLPLVDLRRDENARRAPAPRRALCALRKVSAWAGLGSCCVLARGAAALDVESPGANV